MIKALEAWEVFRVNTEFITKKDFSKHKVQTE